MIINLQFPESSVEPVFYMGMTLEFLKQSGNIYTSRQSLNKSGKGETMNFLMDLIILILMLHIFLLSEV